jgi:uncharacterized coiled-coil protein SlyX
MENTKLKTYKWQYIFVLVVVLSVILVGCGNKRANDESASSPMNKQTVMASKSDKRLSVDNIAEQDRAVNEANNAGSTQTLDKKIIKNADISMRVTEARVLVNTLIKRIEGKGGYVSSSSEYRDSSGKLHFDLVLRMPQQVFDGFVVQIEDDGTVMNKKIYTTDVTEEYIDLEARIKNLARQEIRLQELLNKANKVEELLKIEKEIERVRGEMDSLTGRLNYLKKSVDYSTVNLSLEEKVIGGNQNDNPEWKVTFKNSIQAFNFVVHLLLVLLNGLIVFLVGIIPLVLVATAVFLPIYFYRKNKGKNNNHKS